MEWSPSIGVITKLSCYFPSRNRVSHQKLQEVEALTMEDSGRRKELEAKVLEKVAEVISAIKNAKHVDQVISALHSVAVLLFPVDASIIAGQSRLFSLQFFCERVRKCVEINLCHSYLWIMSYKPCLIIILILFLVVDS